MKILMNCLSSVSGGAVSYLRNLGPLLSARFARSAGEHELIFLLHENQIGLHESISSAQCYRIKGKRPTGWRRVLWERMNIASIIRETRTDILFTPYQFAPRANGVKKVLMLRNMEPFLFHDYDYSWSSRLRNYALGKASSRALRQAARIIAVSGFARDYLVECLDIDENRIRTIHHGRSEELAGENETGGRESLAFLGIGSNFILTCGSMLPYRRCEDVIAAFERCAAHLPAETQLVIAGSGTDKRYCRVMRRAIHDSPHRDRIRPLGHVPWSSMATLYRHCTLCVIATEIEACSNIAIEAMTAGCVIISSDKPPLLEIFEGASVKYRARDIPHLVEQIHRCMTDEDLRHMMKLRSLKRAEAFSWERCATETYAALTDWT